MSFTYTEANSATTNADYISAVRALIQDTDSATVEITDERITAIYSTTSSDDTQEVRNYATAVKAAQDLERRFRKQASYSSGGTSVQLKDRADSWALVVDVLASELFEATMRAAGRSGGVVYAGRGPLYDDHTIFG